MSNQVSQVGAITIVQGTPSDRVSQAGALTVAQGTPSDRVSQAGLLAVALPITIPNRVSQVGIMVIVPNVAAIVSQPSSILFHL